MLSQKTINNVIMTLNKEGESSESFIEMVTRLSCMSAKIVVRLRPLLEMVLKEQGSPDNRQANEK